MEFRLCLKLGVLILQGTAKFKDFSQKLSVHLVECSPALRKIQRETLQCVPKGGDEVTSAKDDQSSNSVNEQISQISGASISWHFDLEQVPRGGRFNLLTDKFS
jgi:NADH dehydrogenase [ubiquinone] 1 alpha subcomplex assembly factor 7